MHIDNVRWPDFIRSIPAVAVAVALAALGTGADEVREWAVIVCAMLAAAVTPAARSESGAPLTLRGEVVRWLLQGLAVGAWVLLSGYGDPNRILLFGGWLLLVEFAAGAWAPGTVGRRRVLVLINLLVAAAVWVSVPDVNGARIRFVELEVPTVLGLYDPADQEFRVVERNQDFVGESAEPVTVALHAPYAGARTGHARLLLKPLWPTVIRIEAVELVNYIGFDGRVVGRLRGADLMHLVAEPDDPAVQLAGDLLSVRIDGPARWLDVPLHPAHLDDDVHSLLGSHSLRALLFWEAGFLILVLLAPRPRAAAAPSAGAPPARSTSWLGWTSAVHVVLVAALAWYMFAETRTPELSSRIVPLNLAYESNYAVWWSGVCFLIAGLVYYHLADVVAAGRRRAAWLIIALLMFALSMDEIASLHERVATFGGWLALAPFGLVGGVLFAFAIGHMLATRETRVSGVLVLVSVALFGSVAILEQREAIKFFEHRTIARLRLIGEETIELVAASLMLLSAAIQLARVRGARPFTVPIVVDPAGLKWLEQVMFYGLMIHLTVVALASPHLWSRHLGDPIYWYPVFAFLLAAAASAARARTASRGRLFFAAGAVVFVLLSMGQMYNHGVFFEAWFGMPPADFARHWWTRLAFTTIPALLFAFAGAPLRHTAVAVLAIAAAVAAVDDGRDLFEAYYVISGIAAFLAVRALRAQAEAAAAREPAVPLAPPAAARGGGR